MNYIYLVLIYVSRRTMKSVMKCNLNVTCVITETIIRTLYKYCDI